MLLTFFMVFCCFVCARADSVEERLNDLERIVDIQRLTIDSLKHENSELKNRVTDLEMNVLRLTKTAKPEDLKEPITLGHKNDLAYTKNETDISLISDNKEHPVNNKISLASKRKSNEFIGRISKRLLGQTGRVAFHVYLTSNRCYNDHEVIDYDGEELDIGNGYNEKDGIYVVPVSGVYVFTWTFLADYAQYAVTEIVVNGEKKGWTITDGTSQSLLLSPSSSLIVTSVNAGDHVFIRRVQGRGCSAVNSQYMRATFSGWQLSP